MCLIWTLTKGLLCLLWLTRHSSFLAFGNEILKRGTPSSVSACGRVPIFIIMHSSQVESVSTRQNVLILTDILDYNSQKYWVTNFISPAQHSNKGKDNILWGKTKDDGMESLQRWSLVVGGSVLKHPSAFFCLSATSPTCWKLEYLQPIRKYIRKQ